TCVWYDQLRRHARRPRRGGPRQDLRGHGRHRRRGRLDARARGRRRGRPGGGGGPLGVSVASPAARRTWRRPPAIANPYLRYGLYGLIDAYLVWAVTSLQVS